MAAVGRDFRRPAHIAHVCIAMSMLIAAGGCAANKVYAPNVPVDLLATRVANPQTIQLSNLAAPTASSESIDRGDVLDVVISAGLRPQDTVRLQTRVLDDGKIELPYVGGISVAGLELEGAESAIAFACTQKELYRSPHVTVTMRHQRLNRVTVLGAVKSPGVYQIPRTSSDLLAALVAAGSLASDAGTIVEINNPNKATPNVLPRNKIAEGDAADVDTVGHSTRTQTAVGSGRIRVDLASAAKRGSNGYYVDDGAVVMVERRDPEPVFVQGLVNKPNRYEYPISEELRVLGAVAMAGGLSTTVADKIYVIRKAPAHEKPVIIQVSMREAKKNGDANILLAPGDTVSVEHNPATVVLEILRVIRFGVGASVGTLLP